jgi:hypothetical protein
MSAGDNSPLRRRKPQQRQQAQRLMNLNVQAASLLGFSVGYGNLFTTTMIPARTATPRCWTAWKFNRLDSRWTLTRDGGILGYMFPGQLYGDETWFHLASRASRNIVATHSTWVRSTFTPTSGKLTGGCRSDFTTTNATQSRLPMFKSDLYRPPVR